MSSSHGVATPIDVVKTKIQASPEKYKGGMVGTAREIISNEGIGFLLAGIGKQTIYSTYSRVLYYRGSHQLHIIFFKNC
jgi:hypothetical protein